MKKTHYFFKIFFVSLFIFSCNDDDDVNNLLPEKTLKEIASDSPNKMVWVDRNIMKSRNGQSSGYGALLNPDSKKLIIFLDGGNACFNGITCALTLSSYTKVDFEKRLTEETSLLIKRDSEINQFKDWNFIFVPYASGDVHSGRNVNLIDIPNGGPKAQNMNGFNNLSYILNDLKNYFTNNGGIEEIVFVGSSAGGFGVLINTDQMATILGIKDIPTTVIVDAGQLMMDETLLTPCLVDSWDTVWSINSLYTSDMDVYINKTYDYDIQKIYEGLSKKYPSINFGFLSHYEDKTNRFFYSFGQEDCKYPPSFLLSDPKTITPSVTGNQFKAGLIDLKTNYLDDFPNWKVFYANGEDHTFLGNENLDQTVDGTTLNEWIAQLRMGTATNLID